MQKSKEVWFQAWLDPEAQIISLGLGFFFFFPISCCFPCCFFPKPPLSTDIPLNFQTYIALTSSNTGRFALSQQLQKFWKDILLAESHDLPDVAGGEGYGEDILHLEQD